MAELTLEAFNDLPGAQQYDIVFEQGVFLERRFGKNSEFSLYAINRFFVELEYDIDLNLIVGKYAFIHGDCLDEYVSIDPRRLLEEE